MTGGGGINVTMRDLSIHTVDVCSTSIPLLCYATGGVWKIYQSGARWMWSGRSHTHVVSVITERQKTGEVGLNGLQCQEKGGRRINDVI